MKYRKRLRRSAAVKTLGARGSYEVHTTPQQNTQSILKEGLRVTVRESGNIRATTDKIKGDTASSRLRSVSQPKSLGGGGPYAISTRGYDQIIFRFPEGKSARDVLINNRIPAKYIAGVRDGTTGQITPRVTAEQGYGRDILRKATGGGKGGRISILKMLSQITK